MVGGEVSRPGVAGEAPAFGGLRGWVGVTVKAVRIAADTCGGAGSPTIFSSADR